MQKQTGIFFLDKMYNKIVNIKYHTTLKETT